MKFRRCTYCILICIVVLPNLTAKPVSLNKLIEEEEKNIQSRRPDRIKPETEQRDNIEYKESLQSRLSKLSKTGSIFAQDKIISPLQYRKTFQIKSPLKARRVKLLQRLNRHKIPTTKRETYQYGPLNDKYIPLLRNIGLLFDNILGPDSGETDYDREENYGDNPDESEELVCTCAGKKGKIARTIETRQKTAASSRVVAIAVTTGSTESPTSTYNPSNDNISSIRRNKNIPLLLTRNTTSIRRNNIRFSERSNTPHFRSTEGYISGTCRNNECNTRDGEIEPHTENDKENSNSDTRDAARIDGLDIGRRGNKYNTRNTGIIGKSDVYHKFETTSDKTIEASRRHLSQHEREDQFEIRGNETKSASVLSKPDSRLRNLESFEEKLLQATENYEKGTINGPVGNATNQQFPERNGEDTEENQTFCGTDETVTKQICGTIQTVSSGNSVINGSSPSEKVVMIFDGYSVARDVNGKNTLTEKAITIHS